ncbi:branched-chain amino acid ABC transporter permease [Pseudarthrobacter sp. NIBRBAC000502772]|uniref:branched-chain amino acid ABC transporter permease n=1 Tax=Pseudarthrobacter sp. NIBRBAC000502772 TaxID=2590775 RepID=UPI0011325E2B|nr:branched-chain amino acid ABC transporter permease [Pseudarthrobacter sp. NIBRBAC000502772]QDG66703.1 branched-chain amino acid ABC transporter permease [Pseudarthrobacter sp. NIBRBAC000502772]
MQVIITALSTAAVLAPMAIGMALVYRIGGVINFAAGAICVVSGVAYALMGGGVVAALAAIAMGAGLGVAVFLLGVLPGKFRGIPPVAMTLGTLGVALIVQALGDEVFGTSPHTAEPWIDGSLSLFGNELSAHRALSVAVSMVAVIAVIAMFDRTLIGRGMEACSTNEPLAQLYGSRTLVYHFIAWSVAGACGALSGVLQAGLASISDTASMPLLVTAIVGAVLGGIGSLRATVLGVLLVAAASALVQQLLNVQLPLTPVFVLMLLGLAIRPAGLFTSTKTGERV